MAIEHSIDDEGDIQNLARAITGYEDDPDELPETDLESLVNVAAMNVYNETGSDRWFDDSGLGQCLLFTLCIRAKERVENYSVSSWTVGDQTIDVRNAGDEAQAQFQNWNQLVVDGLQASDVADASFAPNNTASFIG